MIQVLGVSGSLRAGSANSDLLRAAATLAPDDIKITLYDGLAVLPHFNPDIEARSLPSPVAEWRAQVGAADAILISSPEYAHGVSGALKNALDWLVGGMECYRKPMALLNPSLSAIHAQAALIEILTTMAANLISAASVTLPVSGRNLGVAGIVADADLSTALRAALTTLVDAVENARHHAS